MPYQATVFNVLIASPGDVQEEREIARKVIQDWNAAQPRFSNVLLKGMGWDTDSYPSMDGPPQDVLNKQIVDDADLVVAIFWNRIGTPTATAPGGSVEELRRHMKAGKPAMVYFCMRDIPRKDRNESQLRAVEEFEEECKAAGLIHTYGPSTDFRNQFIRHLGSMVNNHKYFTEARRVDQSMPIYSIPAPPKPFPMLSAEARTLLQEAVLDKDGEIFVLGSDDGYEITTNGKQFVEQGNPRSRAAWEAALEQLVRERLLKDSRGLMYRLTQLGYDTAELLTMI